MNRSRTMLGTLSRRGPAPARRACVMAAAAAAGVLLTVATALGAAVQAPGASTPPDRSPASPASVSTDEAETGWFPSTSGFQPLLATPREVDLHAGLVYAHRSGQKDFRGRNVEADVAVGERLAIFRLRSGEPGGVAVDLGLEVGVFARFFLEIDERDLINADFRVGAPVTFTTPRWEGRVTLLHMSSHLGDDVIERFHVPVRQTSRDGLEVTVARRFGRAFRAYGGGDYNLHANATVERAVARTGVEWDPDPTRAGRARGRSSLWPYAAVDLQVTTMDQDVGGTGVAGIGVHAGRSTLRLELRGQFGPSNLGQLRTSDETYLGLTLRLTR